MEEDDYNDDDRSYGEEQDEEKSHEMDVDRFSYLPKKVAFHILYFLPTKLAVRTSILSRKWRYLWGSVSALDFDDTLLFSCKNGDIHGIGGVNFINCG
ncbi:hypothetical protein V6N11_021476 [Hibiscus sabdariffa]|uniref:F-box domain-containing protein n=2 Tax=Hibiscus sabdariffa TaxID=183260 RepID=A0ABR1ZE73_9ROSI